MADARSGTWLTPSDLVKSHGSDLLRRRRRFPSDRPCPRAWSGGPGKSLSNESPIDAGSPEVEYDEHEIVRRVSTTKDRSASKAGSRKCRRPSPANASHLSDKACHRPASIDQCGHAGPGSGAASSRAQWLSPARSRFMILRAPQAGYASDEKR
jgi:hypothetical protein